MNPLFNLNWDINDEDRKKILEDLLRMYRDMNDSTNIEDRLDREMDEAYADYIEEDQEIPDMEKLTDTAIDLLRHLHIPDLRPGCKSLALIKMHKYSSETKRRAQEEYDRRVMNGVDEDDFQMLLAEAKMCINKTH